VPSPVGHALGALAAGWAASGPADRRALVNRSLIIVALGLAPDLDLLIGRHSMETHSVGAAVLAGAVAAAFRWPIGATRFRIFVTAAIVWSTHPVLDALGADTSPPFGVMMFWPFSREHVMFETVFHPISRRWWLPGFVTGNLEAIARELVILGPATLVAWLLTQRAGIATRRRRDPAGDVQR
jgi:inner membrane protein